MQFLLLFLSFDLLNYHVRENLLQIHYNLDLTNIESNRIRGFLREGRSFGGATAFHSTFTHQEKSIPCAILIPDLTRHTDVVEVIATEFLRENMGLNDGDIVSLKID